MNNLDAVFITVKRRNSRILISCAVKVGETVRGVVGVAADEAGTSTVRSPSVRASNEGVVLRTLRCR